MPTVIFVHGACVRDAAWWWSHMTQPLADLGVPTLAVALPSCGETGGELGDLYADVDACRQAIAAADGPVVLCGHSYGGMIITEAGADDRVTQLLYVTSVMPDAGQSQAELIGSEPAPWLRPSDDGTVAVDPDLVRTLFLQDCDQTTTEQAIDRLTRQSLTPFTQPPRQIAWQRKPATYVVCTEDLATPAEVQRRRARSDTRVVEFTSGHHPFLSRPNAFCANPGRHDRPRLRAIVGSAHAGSEPSVGAAIRAITPRGSASGCASPGRASSPSSSRSAAVQHVRSGCSSKIGR